MFPLTLEDSVEAREYLRGVLFSDPQYRLDPQIDPNLIDLYGTGNKAFWRGLLETAGSITMPTNRQKGYPRIKLKAAPAVLKKLIAFVNEENERRAGVRWEWDDDGRITWQSNGGFILLTGQKAQDMTLALYMGQSVGLGTCHEIANEIISWTPRA